MTNISLFIYIVIYIITRPHMLGRNICYSMKFHPKIDWLKIACISSKFISSRHTCAWVTKWPKVLTKLQLWLILINKYNIIYIYILGVKRSFFGANVIGCHVVANYKKISRVCGLRNMKLPTNIPRRLFNNDGWFNIFVRDISTQNRKV